MSEGAKRSESVCVLDAGSQFVKVIDRRVRDLKVCSELMPFDTPASELKDFGGLIISGGPESVYSTSGPKYDPEIFNLGIPILGICYGMQLMNHIYEGGIERHDTREDGQFTLVTEGEPRSPLFNECPEKFSVLLTHGDSVSSVAPGFRVVGRSAHGIISAIEDPKRKFYGLQFHPEVDLTEHGSQILKNFLYSICELNGTFTMNTRKQAAIDMIRRHVGYTEGDDSDSKSAKKVLVLVSGGVDSSVCAALLQAALPPERIYAVHIDNGFMRQDESALVEESLRAIGLKNLKVVDASKSFYEGTTKIDGTLTKMLKETIKPEHKRKIIGDTFMRVSEEVVASFGLKFDEVFLAQGTLRPDLIESASLVASKGGTADVIKTHHNDTQLVRDLRDAGRIIEPLADYHKDEVRQLGRDLGLPDALVDRQPFPGPGLAVRIMCAPSEHKGDGAETLAKDAAIYDAVRKFEADIDGLGVSLMPFRTVGVQGDGRSYNRCVALSLSDDILEQMSSPSASDDAALQATWDKLAALAKTIPRTVHDVNRVVFLFGERLTGACSTMTPTYLLPDVITQLQAADAIVNDALREFKLVRTLSQVPVILAPADYGVKGSRGICIRTFITNDFMTGVPACPGKTIPFPALHKMVSTILAKVDGISRVCFDLTPKPPGTTEWE